MKRELADMQAMGIIEPASSEWCSPMTFVPKKEGSLRFCIDIREANVIICKDSFLFPRVDDCTEAIGSAKFMRKIDCLRRFRQLPLTSRAQVISSFTALGRTYKFKVMPIGHCNGPALENPGVVNLAKSGLVCA